MKKINTLILALVLCLPFYGFSQDSLKLEKRKSSVDFRMDLLPVFPNTENPSFQGPVKTKFGAVGIVPFREGNFILTVHYNYMKAYSVNPTFGYTFETKHGSIGPTLGASLGKYTGVVPGMIAHAETKNEKFHFFTQLEYLRELNRERMHDLFWLAELSYHVETQWETSLSFGLESETNFRTANIKEGERTECELENQITLFMHVHFEGGYFIGIGYMTEPQKFRKERVENLSAINFMVGIKL